MPLCEIFTFIAALIGAAPSWAQLPATQLTSIFPPGIAGLAPTGELYRAAEGIPDATILARGRRFVLAAVRSRSQ